MLRAQTVAFTLVAILAGATAIPAVPATPTTTAPTSGPTAGGPFAAPTDELSPLTRARIAAEVDRNVDALRLAGRLPQVDGGPPTLFAWPLAARDLGQPGYHGTAGYADHDPAFPNQLLDHACGARTYDTAAGYNHRGVDVFSWPFSWLMMDLGRVEIVAPADGMIVGRVDGNFDRRCGCQTDDPNFVILRHADGAESWYLHMKNGSVTAKGIGATVTTGEYLGVVGSSGCSSGPHLHLEVYDDTDTLVDPWAGACNGWNATSWWLAQPPYREPRINAVLTHDAPPTFPPCPQQEVPHTRRVFALGADLISAIYLRDETVGTSKQLTVYRPDGTVWGTDTHGTPATFDASYWYWTWPLPASGAQGQWRVRFDFEGQSVSRAFWVDALQADDFEDANLDAWSPVVP